MLHTAPIIATGSVYADYHAAARKNLDAMLRLSQALHDREGEREAQAIIDGFDDLCVGLLELIDESEANQGVDAEQFWRESAYARDAGLAA